MNKYGERLKEYRKMNKLTQNAMAEKLEMTQGNYSRLEKGEQDIKLSMILHICGTLDIGTDWFLGVTDEYEDKNQTMEFYIEIVNMICEMEEDELLSDKITSKILKRIDQIARNFDMD